MKLAERNAVPPGGYRFIDPDTKAQFHNPYDITKVERDVRIHRQSNGLPAIPNLREVIIDWMCHRLPPKTCMGSLGEPILINGNHYRTAESSVRATMLMRAFHRSTGGKSVDEKVANERGRICAVCPSNIPSAGCMSCRGIRSIIDGLIQGRHVDNPDRLLSCKVDGVLNRYQIWVDDATVRMLMGKRADFPEGCWKNKLGQLKGVGNERGDLIRKIRRGSAKGRDLSSLRSNRVQASRQNLGLHGVSARGVQKCCGGRTRKP